MTGQMFRLCRNIFVRQALERPLSPNWNCGKSRNGFKEAALTSNHDLPAFRSHGVKCDQSPSDAVADSLEDRQKPFSSLSLTLLRTVGNMRPVAMQRKNRKTVANTFGELHCLSKSRWEWPTSAISWFLRLLRARGIALNSDLPWI
jgi:hypothetical protein